MSQAVTRKIIKRIKRRSLLEKRERRRKKAVMLRAHHPIAKMKRIRKQRMERQPRDKEPHPSVATVNRRMAR
jgi:hypothetical protein